MSKKFIHKKKLISILEEFSTIYKSIGNNIKSSQYLKASISVSNYTKNKICTGKDISELKWIGKGIISKVDEYILTGKIKLLEECRRAIFNYDLKSFSKMFKNNLATQKGKHKVFILDWILFGDAPSGRLIKVDYLRGLLRNGMNERERYNYQRIFREYQNIVIKGINSKIFGSTLENINDDYYEYFIHQFSGAMPESDIASSERVQTFLNNKLWWHCENICGVLPIYYKQNKWFFYENTIIDKEGKLIIPCSVANSIYSIISLYGGPSKKINWTKIARIYNVLPVEKMPIGIMTSKLAEYIYRYAIDKRKKQLKRMKNK